MWVHEAQEALRAVPLEARTACWESFLLPGQDSVPALGEKGAFPESGIFALRRSNPPRGV